MTITIHPYDRPIFTKMAALEWQAFAAPALYGAIFDPAAQLFRVSATYGTPPRTYAIGADHDIRRAMSIADAYHFINFIFSGHLEHALFYFPRNAYYPLPAAAPDFADAAVDQFGLVQGWYYDPGF